MKQSQMQTLYSNYVQPHFSAIHILYKHYQTDSTSAEDISSVML